MKGNFMEGKNQSHHCWLGHFHLIGEFRGYCKGYFLLELYSLEERSTTRAP